MRPTYRYPPPPVENEAILELCRGCPFCGRRPVEANGLVRCPLHTHFLTPEDWNLRPDTSIRRPTRPLLTAAEDREGHER